MKKLDLANVKEDEGRRLVAGGYVCKYVTVKDYPDKEYLYMEYDIARGDYEGYYASLNESFGFWGGKCYRSYKEKALPMFKRMCSAVSKSNNGFVFDGDKNADEKTLEGKLVGIVLGEEEYVGNDGNLKTRLYVYKECPVDDIVNGKFKVPALKKLPEGSVNTDNTPTTDTGFMEVKEDVAAFPFG